MKRSHKFIIAFLVLTVIFSFLTAAVTAFQLDKIRAASNEGVLRAISAVKQICPDISDTEIAKILNGKEYDKSLVDSLKAYGISLDDDWAVYQNRVIAQKVVTLNAVLCGAICLVLCTLFLLYRHKQRAEARRLTEYVERINKKEYDLLMEENGEDEMSLLRNEIYKTTVMLKEQRDNSQKDKESLKDSLSDISHQLRTPLTSILVMVDNILDNDNMPPEIRYEFLRDIRRSATSMSFYVQSILTLSRLEVNSVKMKSKEESLLGIINECIQNTEVLSELKGVTVTAQCDENLNLVCDFKWLSEALTNIVKNCVEHTPCGGEVCLSAQKTKLYVKITICDNGEGITPQDLPHIFERYYKGKNSSDESIGIGLALAKVIIEKSGGIISVYSTVGKGTTFDIRFFPNVNR
ncbi:MULTISPECIES: HAMP domain-containing sensor histidine kinase [unclassified Ruminococcus]|uniref:HAMP domain-containing sensor histidine kinase n=1 Tax=unclassified Ruminococcus TaxID=2608920 RepID=UPI00210C4024|nr:MULTISPECIES: HAMP domain-containing sensor histidine kinase [unclassified Ruminococcus]MCQ4022609.1 sensor histidine kinase [Ruminococcus sp. zg-924]MCQ4114849.1 sensor histidine kinase [Ruminococcus sp. zg-921]